MSTTTPDLQPYRPGLRAARQLLLAEIRSVARDTAGLIVPFVMPALIMVMYGVQSDDAVVEVTGAPVSEVTYLEAFGLPLAIGMVLALIGVVNMPSFLATYRRTGILQRLGVTPLSPSAVLIAQVVTSALQSVVGIGIAFAVAIVAFDVTLPRSPWWALLVLLLGALGMYGLGMVVAAVAPTPNASVAIGLVTFFGIGALGGMFGPVDMLPTVVQHVGSWTPFGGITEGLQAAWLGSTPEVEHLLGLAVMAVVGLLVAVRTFRWDR